MHISLKINSRTEEDWLGLTVTAHGYPYDYSSPMATFFFMKVSRMFCCPKPYIVYSKSRSNKNAPHPKTMYSALLHFPRAPTLQTKPSSLVLIGKFMQNRHFVTEQNQITVKNSSKRKSRNSTANELLPC
jgi:hypothetical protein